MLGFLVVTGILLAVVGVLGMNRLRTLWQSYEQHAQSPWLIPPPEDQPGWTEYARNLKPPSETS